jgi:hypothetical protein
MVENGARAIDVGGRARFLREGFEVYVLAKKMAVTVAE